MAKEKAKKGEAPRPVRADMWSFFLYPADGVTQKYYAEIFDGLGLWWWVLSPLHNQDFFLTDGKDEYGTWKAGELKKPHFHVVFHFGVNSKKSRANVLEIISKFGGVRLQVGNSERGLIRYMTHIDDKLGKAKYRQEDILSGGEVDVGAFFESTKKELTPEERVIMLGEIMAFIDHHDIVEYTDFEVICRADNWEWFTLMMTGARENIRAKINSRRYKKERLRRREALTKSEGLELIMMEERQKSGGVVVVAVDGGGAGA